MDNTNGNLHPAIGKLVRNGQEVFYAYIRGFYTEGSPAVLTAKLVQVQ